uniref:Bcl-2 Bcl-2 homology region 1-3 domain-containing protein n=2 Tax=Amphiprion ocellaris TaxID=80972 RepID=A0AAQ5X412_AMPOC
PRSGRNGVTMGIIDNECRASGGQASRSQNRDEALNKETRQLVKRFLGESTGLLESSSEENEALSTMKRTVRRVLQKYRNVYDGMIEKLPVDGRGDKVTSVSAVACAVFADGAANWGRIVSLVAFGVVLCQNVNKNERGRLTLVESVGEEISTYLLTDQKDWLLKNNSWVGFVEFFAEPRHELRDAFVFIAGFAGIIWALIYFV